MLDLSTLRDARGDASGALARSLRAARRAPSRASTTPLLSRCRGHKPTAWSWATCGSSRRRTRCSRWSRWSRSCRRSRTRT